jgi:uncharacterized protein
MPGVTTGTTARAPWISLALSAAIAAALAALVAQRAADAPWSVWGAAVVGGLLPLVVYLSLGDPYWQRRLDNVPGNAALAIPVLVLAAAAVCLWLSGAEFEPTRWAMLVLVVAGAGALFWIGRESPSPRVADAVAVLLVWLSVEFALLPALPIPPQGRGFLNAAKLLVVPFFVAELLLVRRWDGLGFDLRVKARMLVPAVVAFAVFAAVAIPVALAIGFASVSTSLPPPVEMAGRALAIFVLVALPEELLFRGVIQNGITRALGSRNAPTAGLLLASVVFGAAHLNNPPNVVQYAVLATLAGVAYGWVYVKTGSVVASALVHTAVDWVWSVLFGGAH